MNLDITRPLPPVTAPLGVHYPHIVPDHDLTLTAVPQTSGNDNQSSPPSLFTN